MDSEINIFDSAATVSSVFANEAQGAADRTLFFADEQVFSTRIDVPAAVVRETRQVASLTRGSETAEILFNSDSRVVYTVTGFGKTVIVSSPVAAESAQRKQISHCTTGTDRFQLAF